MAQAGASSVPAPATATLDELLERIDCYKNDWVKNMGSNGSLASTKSYRLGGVDYAFRVAELLYHYFQGLVMTL
jgi:hypothetical protein